MKIIGISAYYHDSACALIEDGKIIAAAQEERFSRIRHDYSFPKKSLEFCLEFGSVKIEDIDAVVFYDKPWLKFERIVETYYSQVPRGFELFKQGLPIWLKEKIFLEKQIRKFIPSQVPIKFSNHHLSHASSAFFPSPFQNACIITMDGVGEWATTTIGVGSNNKLKLIQQMDYPHSVGLLYSSFTQFAGFKVNSGEYKLMGLAPYGNVNSDRVVKLLELFNEICHVYDDGSIWLNPDYFEYSHSLKMINTTVWEDLLQIKSRPLESELTQEICDFALAAQLFLEKIVLKVATHAKKITGEVNLCLAGGVALNCVANGKLIREKIFDQVWIQPAAGDAGGAVGCALGYYFSLGHVREVMDTDGMQNAYLGPEYNDQQIKNELERLNIKYHEFSEINKYCEAASELIINENVIGWFQGRMEFGPRALGNRSIIATALSESMQSRINLKIKKREGFRPFAPVVMYEDMQKISSSIIDSPYMLITDHINEDLLVGNPVDVEKLSLNEKRALKKSIFPAITHVDKSARFQSLKKEVNEKLHLVLSKVKEKKKWGICVNTSFNVRGEPIVESPLDAISCFFHTDMDCLCIGSFIVHKSEQDEQVVSYFLENSKKFELD
ncbi:carbamoyltransferase N-terminal domain-containing protein [Bacteriovorax sp. Seq25_V]|uniref:carbamoyltransferase family protein n=1 Tax=Bacteriovorax sp. Seq25_V TaxID=1201288 RepID=UPI000389EF5F|nr:carbamoyltransferase N-terminal domain-containing protein [Bacteriovorax sp. Seq25_V]EQC45531.1 carbamoyltransferase [Bacteriovorax sp. Seq25_V]